MSTIRIQDLTKRYGSVLGVDDLSFEVRPGRVTGFLGPNGSGKTTTLRILLGLASPSAGTATIGGLPYHRLPDPVRQVGAALDSNTFHPGRSAAQHLRIIATATGLPRRRVDEVLGLTGLADVAGRRVGGFSLGMRQRLSLAGALLGDPGVLVFDEPLNAGKNGSPRLGTDAAVYQMLKFGAITCVVMLILGILAAGSEFRHRTIVPVLLATPHRARVFAVKVAVIAGLGAVFSAVTFGLGLGTVVATFRRTGSVTSRPESAGSTWARWSPRPASG